MASAVNANSRRPSGRVSSREAFGLWSRAYDDQLNPLFNLEERFLKLLLPRLKDLSVLDVGCGTGRWLTTLAAQNPGSLFGIDNSPEMLLRAESKCGTFCKLLLGEATQLPMPDSSVDLVLASFVISYIDQVESLASELHRVTRAGARLFITDVHPETATRLRWRRAFRVGDTSIELDAHNWSLEQIASCFEKFGFKATCIVEPQFGIEEREVLEQAAKADVFLKASGHPPIYLLQLQKVESQPVSHPAIVSSKSSVALTGARFALSADDGIRADIVVTEGRIGSIDTRRFSAAITTRTGTPPTIDLTGYLVIPGLINAHDHLEFGLYPNLGHGPYASFSQWANDIHRRDSGVIEQHRRVPKDVRLWWGAIRNLLCGVTTVCHHDPLSPELEDHNFPVRALTKFGWAHSISMDPELASKFSSTAGDVPFILHLGEGVDEESANEIFQLDRMHALDNRTVLIHGLALRKRGMNLVNRRGAALAWCPSSNYFLFGRTHTPATIASAERVVLGSDSPLTASGDLLDEIHFACFRVGIEARELYQQVTSRPSQVFRLENGEGSILPGAVADLIAVRDLRETPAKTLSQLSYKDIELVLLGGRVQLASESIRRRLPDELAAGLRPLRIEKTLRWVRAPLGRMFGEAERILGCGMRLGGKRVANVATEWP